MKMLNRVCGFSIVSMLIALASGAPALADTYHFAIHNGSFQSVTVRTGRTDCMKRTVSPQEIHVNSTLHVDVETDTKDKHCWQAWQDSELVLVFEAGNGKENVARLYKKALMHWGMSTVTERGIKVRVYVSNPVRIELSEH